MTGPNTGVAHGTDDELIAGVHHRLDDDAFDTGPIDSAGRRHDLIKDPSDGVDTNVEADTARTGLVDNIGRGDLDSHRASKFAGVGHRGRGIDRQPRGGRRNAVTRQ